MKPIKESGPWLILLTCRLLAYTALHPKNAHDLQQRQRRWVIWGQVTKGLCYGVLGS